MTEPGIRYQGLGLYFAISKLYIYALQILLSTQIDEAIFLLHIFRAGL